MELPPSYDEAISQDSGSSRRQPPPNPRPTNNIPHYSTSDINLRPPPTHRERSSSANSLNAPPYTASPFTTPNGYIDEKKMHKYQVPSREQEYEHENIGSSSLPLPPQHPPFNSLPPRPLPWTYPEGYYCKYCNNAGYIDRDILCSHCKKRFYASKAYNITGSLLQTVAPRLTRRAKKYYDPTVGSVVNPKLFEPAQR